MVYLTEGGEEVEDIKANYPRSATVSARLSSNFPSQGRAPYLPRRAQEGGRVREQHERLRERGRERKGGRREGVPHLLQPREVARRPVRLGAGQGQGHLQVTL